ncbi:hypothetical protein Lser_V15G23346 [Lactuca serriola]
MNANDLSFSNMCVDCRHSRFPIFPTIMTHWSRRLAERSNTTFTLLALGNGAPDVFPSVASVGGGNPRTGFDAILSVENFVSALVVGFVAIYAAPFAVSPAPCGSGISLLTFYEIALRKEFADETDRVTSHTKHISSVPTYLSIYSPNDNRPADLFDITSDLSLLGPFTDLEHPKIKKGALNRTYDDLFCLEILRRLLQVSPDEILIESTEVIGQRIKKVDRDTSTNATIIALASGLSESNVP